MTDTPTPSNTMPRRSVLAAAGILGLGASLGAALPATAAGQQGATVAPTGVHLEYLCVGDAITVAGKSLALARIVAEPGAACTARPHPGPVALYVERGWWEMELLEGAGTIDRALVDGMWEAQSDLTPGEVTRLGPGDRFFHDGAVHTVLNTGDERIVLLVATLADSDVAALKWLEPAWPYLMLLKGGCRHVPRPPLSSASRRERSTRGIHSTGHPMTCLAAGIRQPPAFDAGRKEGAWTHWMATVASAYLSPGRAWKRERDVAPSAVEGAFLAPAALPPQSPGP